jgi:TetR/AcrR family transcriptional repressor for divergent bdcA
MYHSIQQVPHVPSTDNISKDTKSRPRGRPRRLDREDGVALAEALFHRHGYDALGIKALCDAVGVRQPALYAAYGSKAELFGLTLARYAAGPYAAFIADAVEGATTPSEALQAVLAGAARLYAADPERTGCMALEASAHASEPAARSAASELVETARGSLATRYAALGADRPGAWADATIVGMRGLSTEARTGRSADDLAAAAAVISRGGP